MELILYTGYTVSQGKYTYYFVDDRDVLSPELQAFQEYHVLDFSFMHLFDMVREGEAEGLLYQIQIKDLFYETIEEIEAK